MIINYDIKNWKVYTGLESLRVQFSPKMVFRYPQGEFCGKPPRFGAYPKGVPAVLAEKIGNRADNTGD